MLAFIGGKVVRTSSIDAIEPTGPDEVNILVGRNWIMIPLSLDSVLTAIEAVEKVHESPTPPPIEVHATLGALPPVVITKGDQP